ncbi:glycosyltransferase [Candidatus Pelagibacter sp.]|jgi:glycosyltransferase involved in cell wall biosynthesis|nr:glycosyltransferase [Candidatus Pelagibacter sp.]
MSQRNLTLVVFALNEIEGLKAVGPRVNNQKECLDRILMIDGGSTDGSIEYAKELGWDVIIQPNDRKGMLNANNMAIENCNTSHMIFFSPDNNCVPEKISEIYQKLQEDNYDFIKVSRYLNGAKSADDTLITGFGNWMFTTAVNIFFNAKYTDVLGIYYAVRKDIFFTTGVKRVLTVNTHLAIWLRVLNKKVCEISGDEPARIGGETKQNIWYNGAYESYTIISLFLIRIFNKNYFFKHLKKDSHN